MAKSKPPVDTEELRRRAELMRQRLSRASDRTAQGVSTVGDPADMGRLGVQFGDLGRQLRDLDKRFRDLSDAAKKVKERLGQAREDQFEAGDPSKPKRTAQERFDEDKAIRALAQQFADLSESAKAVKEAEAARMKELGEATRKLVDQETRLTEAEREREHLAERQKQYYQSGRQQLGSQLSASGVPFVGSGANLGQAFKAGPGGAIASKAGIAGAVIGVVQELANVAATVVQTMNQRTALRGESVAATFRGDAFKAFRAETERTAVVLEKIPIAGNLLAEAFRKTAVELDAFKSKLDAFKDHTDELAAFSPDIIMAKVEGSMLRLQQRMEEARKYGPEYGQALRETNQAEYKLATAMAETRSQDLSVIVGQINDKFAILLGEEKAKQAEVRKGAGFWDIFWGVLTGDLVPAMKKQVDAANVLKAEAKKQAAIQRDIRDGVGRLLKGSATDQIGKIAALGIDLGPPGDDQARGAADRVGVPFLQNPQ